MSAGASSSVAEAIAGASVLLRLEEMSKLPGIREVE
jgi:hypothetical protein